MKAKKNHHLLTLLKVDLPPVHNQTLISPKYSQRCIQKCSPSYSGCLLGQLHWHIKITITRKEKKSKQRDNSLNPKRSSLCKESMRCSVPVGVENGKSLPMRQESSGVKNMALISDSLIQILTLQFIICTSLDKWFNLLSSLVSSAVKWK